MSATTFIEGIASQIGPEIAESVTKDTRLVEDLLSKTLESEVAIVNNIGVHTVRAGGKRLRPAFVTLSARATGHPFNLDRTIGIGVCMELIHMATLVHDDVVDHAPTRRGLETANAIYGNAAAILAGDVMLAKAMVLLQKYGIRELSEVVSSAVIDMAEGEAAELMARTNFDIAFDDHIEILRKKTATFFEACCESGGLIAEAPLDHCKALGQFGLHLGIAFQVVDDLLDYRGDQTKTGKPQATDFREGCATLPLIFLRDKLTEGENEVVRARFGNGVSDDEIHMICNWMENRGCFAQTLAVAREHTEQALSALHLLPDTEGRRVLEALAEVMVVRQF
jgi:octaprenyl-diphosphate synthase